MFFDNLQKNERLKSALQHDSPTPLYHQLYVFLKEKICSGELAFGEQVPTEHQLSEAFNVSRITTKRAMDELSEHGYIARRRGKGSHVIYRPSKIDSHNPLMGNLEDLTKIERNTQVELLSLEKIKPTTELMSRFLIGSGQELMQTKRIRKDKGEAFGYYVSWTRDLGDCYNEQSLKSKSRLDIFSECGITLSEVHHKLSATLASLDMSLLLDCEVGAPLLVLYKSSYDDQGRLIDYLVTHYRPEKFQFEMRLSLS